MFNLDSDQKEAIGLTFIMNKLTPDSPYGVEKKKQIVPFGRTGRIAIAECFDNMEKIMVLAEWDKHLLDNIRQQLMQLKNIRGIVEKCEQSSLHEVELFEVKGFLLIFEKLVELFREANKKINLIGINFQSMESALNILDPELKRIVPFSLESTTLGEIRRKKLQVEMKMQSEATLGEALMEERLRLVMDETTEEMKIMEMLSRELRTYTRIFFENMDMIGELDFMIAKTLLAIEGNAVRPEINDEPTIVLDEMFNPYVEDALMKKGENLTKTSITLNTGVTMVTGANMGGKSVAIKTMVLNTIFAQLGFFVYAKEARIPLFDGVALISGDMQDIDQGLSTFGADIVLFHKIVQQLKNDFLFVALDEFARGTNPEEGAAIVRAVASYLSDVVSISVMTTHYDRVVTPEFEHYQVVGLRNADMDKIRKQGRADVGRIAKYMDYTLIPSDAEAAPPRDALNICRLIGLDSDVLSRIEEEYQE